jgi:hypothetical protein
MGRLDEKGPAALVRMREPVNRFPDFVAYLVREATYRWLQTYNER